MAGSRVKKTLCASLLTFCLSIPIKPISETTAHVGSAVSGIAVGAITGAAIYLKGFDRTSNQMVRLGVSALTGAAVGGLTWYFVYQWLHSLTPPGRVAAAQLIIQHIGADRLASLGMDTQELEAHVTARFGSSWPLVHAREHLMSMSTSLSIAQELLTKAYNEAQEVATYAALCNQCTQLNDKIAAYAATIEQYLVTITKNKKYDSQVKLYEKHMEAERQRQHEASLHHSTLAHDSWERNNDRWHQSSENDKKYHHQQTLLNQNPFRPTILNVG